MDWERRSALFEALQAAGVAVITDRFPFTCHHDWYRTRQFTNDQMPSSRGEVARLMGSKRLQHGDKWYTLAVLSGALYHLFSTQPEAMAMALLHPQAGPLIMGVLQDWQAIKEDY